MEEAEKATAEERPIIAFMGASSKGIDPAHFAEQPPDLHEGEQDADRQHAEDQAVEARIGDEGGGDLAGENDADEGDDGEEDHHRQHEHLRAGQPVGIVAQYVRAARPE